MSSRDEPTAKSVLASSGEHSAVCVAVGDVLAGKYRVESVLGQGGMGVVVAALHLHLQERVALKFLRPGGNADLHSRFLLEARVAAKLRSEHVVQVTDVGTLDSGAPFMVMEFVDGTDLRTLLRSEGPMSVARAVDYVLQACEGLAHAHALGVVHRDLKPSNLLLTKRRDGSALVKVFDFGISKARVVGRVEDEDLTTDGMMLGSPRYMAPEQILSTADVDPRSDVWSLGVVLYEMLAGDPPYSGSSAARTCVMVTGSDPPPSLRDRRPDVPEALEAAILRALERDPSRRTPNVAELADNLVRAVDLPVSVALGAKSVRSALDAEGLLETGSIPHVDVRAPPSTRSASWRLSSGAIVGNARGSKPRRRVWGWVAGAGFFVVLGAGAARLSMPAPEGVASAPVHAGPGSTPQLPPAVPSAAPSVSVLPSASVPSSAPTTSKAPSVVQPPRPRSIPAPRKESPPARPVDPLSERQ
jgi:serine/threonine-protein kinase